MKLALRQSTLPVAESKVNDFNMAIRINQNIFRFQISVDYAVLVHKLNCYDKFRSVEFCAIHSKLPCFPNVEEHITTVDVLHYKVKSFLLVEISVKLDNEWASLERLSDLKFLLQIFDMIFFFLQCVIPVLLFQNLHGVNFVVILIKQTLNKDNRTVRTFTYRCDELKLLVDILFSIKVCQ